MSKPQPVGEKATQTPKDRRPAPSSLATEVAAPESAPLEQTVQRLAQAPQTLSSTEIVRLQRLVGNRALSHALAPTTRVQRSETAHSTGCACPACSRTTTTTVQRQTEHGAGCGCSSCDSSELVQTKRETNTAALAKTQHKALGSVPFALHPASAHPAVIQRHSSWEHQLLGDMPPKLLAEIGTWQDLIDQTKREKKGAHFWSSNLPNQDEAEVDVAGVGKIKKGQVMHVLAQELQRLSDWQQNPPTSRTDSAFLSKYKDPEWGVVLVTLPTPSNHKPLVVTYGELNTLADFYGNLEAMKKADHDNRKQIVQSVRQETFFRLKDIYKQLEDSLTDTEKTDQDVTTAQGIIKDNGVFDRKRVGYKFNHAMTPDYISGQTGQVELLKGVQKTGAQGETNAYGATLARNACHFVPESWHAWAKYHAQARELASQAYASKQKAIQLNQTFWSQKKNKNDNSSADDGWKLAIEQAFQEAEALENEALLNNGFGDHYLQDSYAAGHMINKTQVMQWYVEWIDSTEEWDYFKDKNWRKVQQMAYKQPGLANPDQYNKSKVHGHTQGAQENQPQNPQSVEDLQGDDWMIRFKALGLQVPASLRTPGSPERQLVEWWQQQPEREQLGNQLVTLSPLKNNKPQLKTALVHLLDDGIIRVDGMSVEQRGVWMRGEDAQVEDYKAATFILRDDYVPSKENAEKFKGALTASQQGDDSQYQRMAASVAYGDYFEFIKSGFIQKATNALHDTFCKGGLKVYSGDGTQVFKVYGDDAMFNKESAAGVKHSGETANNSRDAILNLIQTGTDKGLTTASILDRLPNDVQVDIYNDQGALARQEKVSLEKWHNPGQNASLKQYCFTDVFPAMSWSLKQKLAPGVFGSELGTISRDEAVHGGDAF